MKKYLVLLLVALLGSAQNAFALLADTQRGPQTWSNGGTSTLMSGPNGALVTQDLHPRYMLATYSQMLWTCASLAGTSVTTPAGLNASLPALALYNPISSQRNLVLIEAAVAPTAAPVAAAQFMIAYNVATSSAPSGTTLGTVQNSYLSNTGSPFGQCYRVCSLPATPVAIRYIGGTTGAAAISGAQFVDYTDGKIIVPPGATISIQSTSAAAILAHLVWEEIPL